MMRKINNSDKVSFMIIPTLKQMPNTWKNLYEFIKDQTDQRPGKIIFQQVQPDGSIKKFDNLELLNYIYKISEFFLQNNIKKGDYIYIISTNNYEGYILLLACFCFGVIPVNFSEEDPINYLQADLENFHPKIIFYFSNPALQSGITSEIEVEHIFSSKDSKINPMIIEGSRFDFLKRSGIYIDKIIKKQLLQKIEQQFNQLNLEDTACILRSSGTTGNPKWMIIPHRYFIGDSYFLKPFLPQLNIENQNLYNVMTLSYCPSHKSLLWSFYMDQILCIPNLRNDFGLDLKTFKPITSFLPLYIIEKTIHLVQIENKIETDIWRQYLESRQSIGRQVYEKNPEFFQNNPKPIKDKFENFDKLVIEKFGGAMKYLRVYYKRPDLWFFFKALGIEYLTNYGTTEFNDLSHNIPGNNSPYNDGILVDWFDYKVERGSIKAIKGPVLFSRYIIDGKISHKGWTKDGWFNLFDNIEYLPSNDQSPDHASWLSRKDNAINLSTNYKININEYAQKMFKHPLIKNFLFIGENKKFLSVIIDTNFEQYGVNNLTDDHIFQKVQQKIQSIIDEINKPVLKNYQIKQFILVREHFPYLYNGKPNNPEIKEKYRDAIDELYGN